VFLYLPAAFARLLFSIHHTMSRICIGLVIASLAAAPSFAEESKNVPGLSAAKPFSGPSVQTDRGFMVPYSFKIPGTDVEVEMVPIPGGTFTMGSPEREEGRTPAEGPQFTVTVEPFWMGKTEVTWGQYKEFMKLYEVMKEFASQQMRQVNDENKLDAVTIPTPLYEPTFTYEFGEDPQLPAVTMTQFAAKQYTKWLSGVTGQQFRIPSEAEWEYAARAGAETAYSFGDDPAQLEEYAWYGENSDYQPHHVAKKKPNPWGLYDMHGNVWEWVLDEYAEDGYKQFAGKTLKAADAVNWPTKAYPRTVKGGSWDDDADKLRAAAKMGSDDKEWKSEDPNLPLSPWWLTTDPARGVGFRIIRPLKELPKAEMAKYWEADVEDIKLDVENRLLEGRGVLGVADPTLPSAVKQLGNGK
jgi:formylglycine-generating enzyme required for sulfatase activity